jgi:predicted glycoside hydrolase/deacetylase ChbG (UPF0249 family)
MILSADDFGISPSVNEGILELLGAGRISSTSCMVLEDIPSEQRQGLKSFLDQADIGLHFVLTNGAPKSMISRSTLTEVDGRFFKFRALAMRSYSRVIDEEEVFRELDLQVQTFRDLFGNFPLFIDGHLHVQQLPIVRKAVVRVMKMYEQIKYVRVASLPLSCLVQMALQRKLRWAVENLAIEVPGKMAKVTFDGQGVCHNRYLLGYYDHGSGVSFRDVFKFYMDMKPNDEDIFFCHPGYIDSRLRSADKLVESRLENMTFLKSQELEDICGHHGISIGRSQFWLK